MNLSAPFIKRPIATVLLTCWLGLIGVAAFFALPIANMPVVDFPAISVSANLQGASPTTMAWSVAEPLERRLATLSGVNEITSNSGQNSTNIQLQFDLNRDIDAAARDVMAAISAARLDLPSTLRSNPSYRKANNASQPVIVFALTSKTHSMGQVYDAVDNTLSQSLQQIQGVGNVNIGGAAQPAVRVEIQPFALNKYGISLEDIRTALESADANRPKGAVADHGDNYQIYSSTGGIILDPKTNKLGLDDTNATNAVAYRDLVIANRNGSPVRLSDVAEVIDSVGNYRIMGQYNGEPALIVTVVQQPGANMIDVVRRVRAELPRLELLMRQSVGDIKVTVTSDLTVPIRQSLRDVEITLGIAVLLVILVVSAFLRSWRATIIPAVATIVSLSGAIGCMYALHFTINNISLMALTVATGFVVDDAIVVLENTTRHIENGMNRFQAALRGAQEVGFTVVAMSISLVAVFIPLLFMSGQQGRIFREFAITLSASVLISLIVSLTTTPMMCAYLLKPEVETKENWFQRLFHRAFDMGLNSYKKSLDWALNNKPIILLIIATVIGLNIYLYGAIRQGGFPQQDSERLNAGIRGDQSMSSTELGQKLLQAAAILRREPTIATVTAQTGAGGRGGGGGGQMQVDLKPKSERNESALRIIARLRPQLARITGVNISLNPVQSVMAGGRQTNSTYQYTLKSDNAADLKKWAQALSDEMSNFKQLQDVQTDQQDNGVETYVNVDRDHASMLGVNIRDVDNALSDNFGQKGAATIYKEKNNYQVIMEAAPAYQLSPEALNQVYVPSNGTAVAAVSTGATVDPAAAARAAAASAPGAASSGVSVQAVNPALRDAGTGNALSTSADTMVPLSTFATINTRSAPTSVNHQDGELATTVSFNLPEGVSLSDAEKAIAQAQANIAMPINVRGSFQGTARSFTQQRSQEPILITAALIAVYIVLGILYESLIHPITVISTLPSAGVGAVLALMIMRMEFSLIALIGVFLLIGLVKKNAIMIIDFAIEAMRSQGMNAEEAARYACILRYRPILMTTFAAGLGALPLAIGLGEGSELRQPLGVTIIGGLIASQLLTLLTTPVIFVYLDRFSKKKPSYLAKAMGAPTPPELKPA